MFQAGYREGITAGKESALQGGFDEGFAQTGAPLGRQLGLFRGFASALLSYLSNMPDPLPQHEALMQETRVISAALGNIRFSDIVPPDLEAEAHAREHLETANNDDDGDLVPNEELQEKRDMEGLEDSMTRMSAGAVASVDNKARPTAEDVTRLASRLQAVASQLSLSLPEG